MLHPEIFLDFGGGIWWMQLEEEAFARLVLELELDADGAFVRRLHERADRLEKFSTRPKRAYSMAKRTVVLPIVVRSVDEVHPGFEADG